MTAAAALIHRLTSFWANQLGGTFLAPGSTLSLAALAITLIVAGWWLVPAHRSRRPRWRVLARALFPRRMWRSASGRADLGWFAFSLMGYGLVFGGLTLGAGQVAAAVEARLGPGPVAPVWPAWIAAPLLTVALFVAYEFAYWLDHWLSHKVPAFWQLHRVHHSAESLSIFTNFRVHPLETIKFAAIIALVTGGVRGVALHVLGPVSDWQIGGTNILLLGFAVAVTHVQHSHLWVSFGPRWGKWLFGPAHHQIHHSADPAHYDRNFGSSLTIFDRLAGTFYQPAARREALSFGVELLDPRPHGPMAGLVMPVVRAMRVAAGYSAASASSARSWAWRFHISA
ncbi:sterol desaturase family protein [Sphingomonas sp. GlSt437]|uniref:sterol desaturase family protein n=1 Tax=Sphingomonas sp. GlSt437 TaxID=3389970 RepID=UPI003A8BF094